MKNGIRITTDVRSLINIPAVLEQIDGKVSPYYLRDKDKVSIVVSCFAATNQFIQNATVNVNIHCPLIKDSSLPDLETFNRVANLVLPLLDCQWKNDFNTEVESPGIPIRDADGSYFYNIRVIYRSLQTDYKNI